MAAKLERTTHNGQRHSTSRHVTPPRLSVTHNPTTTSALLVHTITLHCSIMQTTRGVRANANSRTQLARTLAQRHNTLSLNTPPRTARLESQSKHIKRNVANDPTRTRARRSLATTTTTTENGRQQSQSSITQGTTGAVFGVWRAPTHTHTLNSTQSTLLALSALDCCTLHWIRSLLYTPTRCPSKRAHECAKAASSKCALQCCGNLTACLKHSCSCAHGHSSDTK